MKFTPMMIVLGEVPEQVPEGWLIYAGEKPLMGSASRISGILAWKGKSVGYGEFYAAVNPADPNIMTIMNANRESDAYLVIYASADKLYALGKERLLLQYEYSEELRALILDTENRQFIVSTQLTYEQMRLNATLQEARFLYDRMKEAVSKEASLYQADESRRDER